MFGATGSLHAVVHPNAAQHGETEDGHWEEEYSPKMSDVLMDGSRAARRVIFSGVGQQALGVALRFTGL